jgi:hypothetical protein
VTPITQIFVGIRLNKEISLKWITFYEDIIDSFFKTAILSQTGLSFETPPLQFKLQIQNDTKQKYKIYVNVLLITTIFV